MVRSFAIRRRPLRLGRRILRVSLKSAAILALPFVLGTSWYVGSTYVRFERYRRAVDAKVSLDPELFQLFLHDELTRDLRRLRLPAPPSPPTLPMYELSIGPAGLATLREDAEGDKKRRYVGAALRQGDKLYEVDVRHQGRRHWHALGVQKSMKVRAKKGDLVNGVRVFNLVNDVTPFGLEEELILDIARDYGLLTPAFHPVRVRLNNSDLGVFRFDAQPDEGLLRRQRRMPGSLYSGDFKPTKAPHNGWNKFGATSPDAIADLSEIDELLAAMQTDSHRDFDRWAKQHVDFDRFAFLDALDVVFGGDQHDFTSNQKLYFDHYRGRFEPIARDFRAFTHEPWVNLAENPLQLRLKALPDYTWQRDRHVYRLITGVASVAAMRKKVDAAFQRMLPELAADPYWDAYKLLGRASRFHRFMVRPMNVSRWVLASRAELHTYATRNRFLLDQFEARDVAIRGRRTQEMLEVEVEVGGYEAVRLHDVSLVGATGRIEVFADANLNGVFDPTSDPKIATGAAASSVRPSSYDHIVPGMTLAAVTKQDDIAGPVFARRVPRVYRYFVRWSEGAPPPVSIELESLITGGTIRRVVDPTDGEATRTTTVSADVVPQFLPNETTPHPWSFDAPGTPEVLDWTGEVSAPASVDAAKTVRIKPGTIVTVDAELEFRGRVEMSGSAASPIVIKGGTVRLRGRQTAGSSFENVRFEGGALKIFDTQDVRLEDVEFAAAGEFENVLHATYVENLQLYEVAVNNAPADAVDLEHATAEVRGLRVIGAGDECLDLMASTLRLTDSLLLGCKNNAVSAGEETNIQIFGSAIIDAKVGILSKNASTVRISRSLLYRTKQALRTNRRDVHYDAASRIDADEVYAVDCDTVVRRAKQTKIDARVETTWPTKSRMQHLETSVLGIERYDDLDRRITTLRSAP